MTALTKFIINSEHRDIKTLYSLIIDQYFNNSLDSDHFSTYENIGFKYSDLKTLEKEGKINISFSGHIKPLFA